MKKYIERKGYLEEVWKVTYMNRYFDQVIFVRGTEPEMHDYLESEFGFVGKYTAMNDSELDAIKKLKLKIYIAPELGR